MKTIVCVLVAGFLLSAKGEVIDLSGNWQLWLDPRDTGLSGGVEDLRFDDTIQLPGTTALAGKGEPLDIEINLEKPCMQHLHQRFRYVGPAWYQRKVAIPANWSGKDAQLLLERVIWQSRVWINGQEAGRPQNSLVAPHRYEVGALLKPGEENIITLRVDNRPQVDLGVMSHAYTDETQTIWNGVIGRIELRALDQIHLESLRLRPAMEQKGMTVTLSVHNETQALVPGTVRLRVLPENHQPFRPLPTQTKKVRIFQGASSFTFFVPMGSEFKKWSEFAPEYYSVRAVIEGEGFHSEASAPFGMREFKADGRQFTINGQTTFLRGDLECAIFPRTGHPDMSGKQWNKIFTTAKAHGLNHFRFHSWCPPEAAFDQADRHGFYLQVELPNWTFQMGENQPVDEFLTAEALRIIKEYGNHPSFVMLSLGNELKGNFEEMDLFIAALKAEDPQRLYTSTSYSFSPRGRLPGANDDYFISQKTQCGWVRGQGFLNSTPPNTDSDYANGLDCINIPLVTHEVGQYGVYPNLAEIPKYDASPLRPTAWEAIEADLRSKGRLDEAARYTRDSGKLAAILYKEDVERALRTKGLAGIQLLQLQDYPGQGTATVGLLDSFWDGKGIIEPAAFRAFCSPSVALARMKKFTWENTETFRAGLEVAHFGPGAVRGRLAIWKLADGQNNAIGSGVIPIKNLPLGNGLQLGTIEVPLGGIQAPSKLQLQVHIPGVAPTNTWPVWVYPAASPASKSTTDHVIAREINESVLNALKSGGRVLLLPPPSTLKKPVPARFIPVFWSPLHFPHQPGTLGATIDTDHPLWRDFPTDTHTDWQWWELTANSVALDLDGLDPAIAKPFRFIDKFNRNALPTAIFEARVGKGRLLVCTLDVSSKLEERIVARQLRRTLVDYVGSDRFQPSGRLAVAELERLIGGTR